LRLPPTNNSSPSGAGRAVAFDSIPIGFVGAITREFYGVTLQAGVNIKL
jgi:hypothetical protein